MFEIAARAKINLFLNVLDRRPDGYHGLVTIMQNISLADTLRLAPGDEAPRVTYKDCVTCDFHDDLVLRAWKALTDETGSDMTFNAEVFKRIPVAAGLGGGSADAAAALLGLNKMFDLGLTKNRLRELAAGIGADVPFFITGGTMLAEGAGEILSTAPAMPDCRIVVIKPEVDISTGRAYQDYDDFPDDREPADAAPTLTALKNGDYEALCASLFNSFEPAMFAKHPEIADIKEATLSAGADAALMSGSGSTVFALTRSEAVEEKIADAAGRHGAKIFFAEPCNTAVTGLD